MVDQEPTLELIGQENLSDYVTAIAWAPQADRLAVSSAAGEVSLWNMETGAAIPLRSADEKSINALAFSGDGQFLAAGGQGGWLGIWEIDGERVELSDRYNCDRLNCGSAWIDQLAWSPSQNQLAFNLSNRVAIWDAQQAGQIAELPLSGTTQALAWHPDGQQLAIACKSTAQIWQVGNWQGSPPYCWEMRAAVLKLAWSSCGRYLAVANLDQTVLLQEWRLLRESQQGRLQGGEQVQPFIMQGFPGKIRQLLWSKPLPNSGEPLLVVGSGAAIAIWERQATHWESGLLEFHHQAIQDLAFQPGTFLLASASKDGRICLWDKAETLVQILEGANKGFSCLAWHPQGQALAAGGEAGEVLIWMG